MQKRKRTQSKNKRFKKKQKLDRLDLYSLPPMKNWKMIDTSNTGKEFALDSTTAATSYLNPISGGDTILGRDGYRVSYKSIEFRGQIYSLPPLAGNYPNDTVSMALVYDKQPDGLLPTWPQVFQGVDGRVDAMAPINFASGQRFMVLRRWVVATNNFVAANGPVYTSHDATNITAPWEVLHFHKSLKLKLGSVWSANSGVIGNLQTGGFFLISQANTATPGTSPWYLDYTCRLVYTDNIVGV